MLDIVDMSLVVEFSQNSQVQNSLVQEFSQNSPRCKTPGVQGSKVARCYSGPVTSFNISDGGFGSAQYTSEMLYIVGMSLVVEFSQKSLMDMMLQPTTSQNS